MQAFEDDAELDRWLRTHHDSRSELWVRVFKKGSDIPSVNWDDCVIAALAWGWIDGRKRSLDAASYLQRLTPRRAGSTWSSRNRDIAERLIAEGRMQPSGLAQVEAARRNGRWETAYAKASEMVMPEDFVSAVELNSSAKAAYDELDRATLFVIYHRLQTARTPELRRKRFAGLLSKLARGEGVR